MANLTNPALSTSHDPAQFIGRSITWLKSTGNYTGDANMTAALRAIASWGTLKLLAQQTRVHVFLVYLVFQQLYLHH